MENHEEQLREIQAELARIRAANAELRNEVQANRVALNQQAAVAAGHEDHGEGEDEDDPMEGAPLPLPPVAAPAGRNLMKLRLFAGDQRGSDPWQVWRLHAEDAIDVNGWDIPTTRKMIAGAMTGEAGIFAVELRAYVRENCHTVKDILDAYEQKVLPKCQRDNLKTAFGELKQKEGESPQYLACRMRALYQQVWPNRPDDDDKEETLVDAFIKALIDRRQAKEVAKFRPKTLDDCVDRATEAIQWEAKEAMIQHGTIPQQIYHIVDPRRYFDERNTVGTGSGHNPAINVFGQNAPPTQPQPQPGPAGLPYSLVAGQHSGPPMGAPFPHPVAGPSLPAPGAPPMPQVAALGSAQPQVNRNARCGKCNVIGHKDSECNSCWNCGSPQHFKRDCNRRGGNRRNNNNRSGGRGRGRSNRGNRSQDDNNGNSGNQNPASQDSGRQNRNQNF